MAQGLSFVLHHGYPSNAPLSDPWLWLLGYSAVQARERSWLCQATCESDEGRHTRDGAQSRGRWYIVSTQPPPGAVAAVVPTPTGGAGTHRDGAQMRAGAYLT